GFNSPAESGICVRATFVNNFSLPSFEDRSGKRIGETKRDRLSYITTIELWQITATVPARVTKFFLKLRLDGIHLMCLLGARTSSSALRGFFALRAHCGRGRRRSQR